MTGDEWKVILEERGYKIVSKGRHDWSFWVHTGPGNQRLINVKELLESEEKRRSRGRMIGVIANSDETSLGGKPRYIPHDGELNPERTKCIDDYASEVGRREWKNYYVERDRNGNITREGPRPFKNRDERRAYERLTNQRWLDQ